MKMIATDAYNMNFYDEERFGEFEFEHTMAFLKHDLDAAVRRDCGFIGMINYVISKFDFLEPFLSSFQNLDPICRLYTRFKYLWLIIRAIDEENAYSCPLDQIGEKLLDAHSYKYRYLKARYWEFVQDIKEQLQLEHRLKQL